ncbi:translation initiation factor IF-2 [candidate division KSB1 bacterium]|nr:translation initiation factor IF-2 [candidate division KSB1 bacterium]
MSVKKRVFQVAREFNISNEELVAFLTKLDYDIRNHMSPVSDDAYEHVVEKFGEKAVPADGEYEFRKRLRDRKLQEQEQRKKTKEDLERRIRFAQELAQERPKLKKQREQEKPADKVPPKAGQERPTDTIEDSVQTVEPGKVKRPRKKLRIVEIPPEGGEKRQKPEAIKVEKVTPSEKRGKAEEEKAKEAKPKTTADSESEKPKDRGKKKRRRRRKKPEEAETPQQAVEESKERRKKKHKKKKKPTFDEAEIQETIRQTLATMEEAGRGKKRRRKIQAEAETVSEEKHVIRVSEFMSLSELAKLMDEEPTELIKKCMELGMMVSINQRLDMDTITLLAAEHGYEVEALAEFGEDILDEIAETDEDDSELLPRPPVVTIMGHVDHGKTSLLDYIRSSNIIAGEAGGITQHIGAYEVTFNDKEITFLDTPGHEAFTAMRARGAQVTDIVVLVVAADDSVMPQTIEAISHAKAAGVPIVVAINKIDKPNANPDLIRKQLSEHNVLVEQWGGKVQAAEISAKTGQAIDHLLEMILLEAEMLDLKANPHRNARGVIIESRLDRGKGVVATVLVQNGTLRIGEPFVAGSNSGKVRTMFNERMNRVKDAGPSVPVQVLGFNGMPQSGDTFLVLESERDTKEISSKRQQLQREHEHWQSRPRTLDEISRQIQKGQVKQLSLVVKADVDGSIEAIVDALLKLSTHEVAVNIIHRGVGAISESDVLLASASGAIIIGFNVRPATKARDLAAKESVDIRSYNVIYDIVDDIKSALEGFLAPHVTEKLTGTVEVRQTFKVPKVGIIAGCSVISGFVQRNNPIKLYRDDRLIYEGKISSLKRFKDDVKEVATGFECGISLEGFNDIKVNDIMESYEIIETKRSL